MLKDHNIRISMDGKGRAVDNIMIERLWRTVKYEEIYLKEDASVLELIRSLQSYFSYYNSERSHSSLDKQTPNEIYDSGFASSEVA